MTKSFDGLVAVVTGGASGIGLAVVGALAALGAAVASLDLEPGPDDEGVLSVKADVTSQSSVDAAVATVADRFGGIDILVNNAGIGDVGTVEDNDDDE